MLYAVSVFEEYYEALKHSNTLRGSTLTENDILAKNHLGNVIPTKEIYDEMENIYYFNIYTSKGLEFVQEAFKSERCDYFPLELGEYRYDADYEEWKSKKEEFEELNGIWNFYS